MYCLGKVNRPTMFFYLAVATSTRDEERGEKFCLRIVHVFESRFVGLEGGSPGVISIMLFRIL